MVWKKIKIFDKKLYNNPIYKWATYIPRKVVHIIRHIRQQDIKHIIRVLSIEIHEKFGGISPLVSVIMPVYNVEKYLEQAMDSLLNQSMKHIEIIAVDDGSTDNSLEILKRYASIDKRVKVFTQKNQYAGVARNVGLSKARGEYVLFLDSDDFFEMDLVKETYYTAKLNKADIVMFGANYYDETTKKVWKGKWLLNTRYAPKKQPFSYKDCPDTIYQISIECPWTKLFRRQFILDTKLQFQDLFNANDVFFVTSAIAMAQRIVTYDKQFVNYRVGLKNNLQSSSKRCFYEALLAWHDKLIEIGCFDEVRRSYVNSALGGCLKNLHVVNDYEMKKNIFEKLKNEAFNSLELFGYEKEYYYNEGYYNEMMLIQSNDFEEYMLRQK